MNKFQKEINFIDETKEDITFDARTSTVFYKEWYHILQDFPIRERDKAYKYIFEYAFYGVEPKVKDKTSPSYVAFRMAKPNVDHAQKRYDAATENGQKGGRPKKVTGEVVEKIVELRKNGMTQQQVATELSLSLKTIQRVEKDISQNHNVNVNDNVNDNVNVNNVASKEDDTEHASQPVKKKYFHCDIPLYDGTLSGQNTKDFYIRKNDLEHAFKDFTNPSGKFKFDKSFVIGWFKEEYGYEYKETKWEDDDM